MSEVMHEAHITLDPGMATSVRVRHVAEAWGWHISEIMGDEQMGDTVCWTYLSRTLGDRELLIFEMGMVCAELKAMDIPPRRVKIERILFDMRNP